MGTVPPPKSTLSNVVWTKDQPAVVYVRKLIFEHFPAVGLHWDAANTVKPTKDRSGKSKYITYRDHPKHGVGGFVSRKTEAGKTSTHSEGRSADIYVDAKNAYLKRFGDELFARVTANATALGVEQVIWNLQIWTVAHPTVRSFVAKKGVMKDHKDHLHLQFTRQGSQATPVLLETLIKDAAKVADAAF